jgi:nucleoside-diphosphate-sugar epimerase
MFFRRVCERLLDGGVFEIYGSGAQSRSFTYVDDVIAATRAALDSGATGIYNVGGGDEASMRDAIGILEDVSGRRLNVRAVAAAKGDMARTSADIARIAAEVGWVPRTSLRDGLSAMWSWAVDTVAAG